MSPVTKYLFFVGNKRSGTSLLTKLLNLHSKIYISFEADTIWLLFQLTQGELPKTFEKDDAIGLQHTLKHCPKDILEDVLSQPVAQQFTRIQLALMKKKWLYQKRFLFRSPQWLGDKKPVQHGDPRLFDFIESNFSECKYIHIIRNPNDVIQSMKKAVANWPTYPAYWRNDDEILLAHWIEHEKRVERIRNTFPDRLLTIKYEDLCAQPSKHLSNAFSFLGLRSNKYIIWRAKKIIRPTKSKERIDVDQMILTEALEAYGYESISD